jgi:hypothetical protein
MPRHERLRVVSGHLEANLTAVAHRTLEDLAPLVRSLGRRATSLDPLVRIDGQIDDDTRGGIERCLGVALNSLAIDRVTVHITESNKRLPRGLVAGAASDGIWLRKSVLKEDRVLLASILLEEAAHLKLIELGAIDGLSSFTGALVNEFFATWYAFYELMQVQPSITERFDDAPLPPGRATPKAGYVLGALLGAAAAGVPAAQSRLDTWLHHSNGDPAIRSAVLRLQKLAASADSPLDMARVIAERFPGWRESSRERPSGLSR